MRLSLNTSAEKDNPGGCPYGKRGKGQTNEIRADTQVCVTAPRRGRHYGRRVGFGL